MGAVILSPDGVVIAEGYHRGVLTAHAEVDALATLPDGAARGATAVVTLEPCNHVGNTGPCSEALIRAGIARVVFAVADPGLASGGGAQRLRDAGLDVEPGVRAREGEALLASWLTVQRLGRPHVTVKWAQSIDGRAAAADGTSQWITGVQARANAHSARADADAIVVGTGTVLADDPALTARDPKGALFERQPVPVIIGTREIPVDAAVFRHPHPPLFHRDICAALEDLRARGVHRVFVEGGPTLASAFVRADLADELLIYLGPVLLGAGRPALADIGVDTIGEARRLDVASVQLMDDGDLVVVAHPRTERG